MILVRLVRIILNIPVGSARTLPAPPASASDPRPVIGPTVVPQFFAGCGIVALILIGLLGLGFGILAWQRAEASAHPPSVWAYPALGLAGGLYYYLFTLLLRVLRGPLAPADEPRPAPGAGSSVAGAALSPPRDCPRCGQPIPAGSPQGLCPRCLLAGVM